MFGSTAPLSSWTLQWGAPVVTSPFIAPNILEEDQVRRDSRLQNGGALLWRPYDSFALQDVSVVRPICLRTRISSEHSHP
jgi:hypothetical protein